MALCGDRCSKIMAGKRALCSRWSSVVKQLWQLEGKAC
jgi:hypothetical protein